MLNQGVGSWLNRRREKSRDSAALIFDGRSISYLELLERVDSLANALRERGVQKGSRIAYLGENHPSFLETFFASATLGAIFVPLNTRLAAAEINFSLLDSGSTVLVHSESLSHIAIPASEQTAVAHRIIVEDLDSVIAAAPSTHLDVAVGHDDPAIILYTSGTTGQPKGALLTHGNLIWNSINVIVDYDFASTDIALMISPMFHVASLGMGVLPTLLKGGTLVLEQKFDPARVLELIERHRVTAISGVPTTFQMLCEHPNWAAADLSSLNKLTCGGSAVPQRVAAAFEQRGLSFSGGYGMSETAPGATSLAPAMSAQKAGSAGLPHFFTEIRIVDEQGGILRSGEVGEIQIMGPNVIAEYWNRPEATQSSFADELWFRSGDLGYTDDDGFLFISDRLKDMIISGGENVYPAQVEQVILERAEVASVAVFGVADEKWGEVPWAAVVLRDGAVLGADELRAHLETSLARYKIPRQILFVDDLPRTASGKVRKVELRARYEQGAP